MKIGSEEHKELFCRSFIASHQPYDPAGLPWPDLDAQSLGILRSIPVWSLALQVESNAGAMIAGFALKEADPLIREALLLQGREEERHGRMIRALIDRYALPATVVPPEVQPTRRAFIDFGYNECLDSFFGFGVFQVAKQSGILPDSLTSLFSRVLWEEARHIVFFVNWIAYDRAVRGWGWTPAQTIAAMLGYARALRRTIGRAGAVRTEDKGLQVVSDVLANLTPLALLQACLRENARHMAQFDARLIQPRLIPALARFAAGVLGMGARLRLTGARPPATRGAGPWSRTG